jgi:hypothetical protein
MIVTDEQCRSVSLSWHTTPSLPCVAGALLSFGPHAAQRPYEHDVRGRLNDPSLSYKHVYNETVPVVELWTLSFDLPLIVTIALGLLRVNVAEVHSGVLSVSGLPCGGQPIGRSRSHAVPDRVAPHERLCRLRQEPVRSLVLPEMSC